MRQYIKAWITQWDMLRLGEAGGAIVEETVRSNYDEDEGLGAAQVGLGGRVGLRVSRAERHAGLSVMPG